MSILEDISDELHRLRQQGYKMLLPEPEFIVVFSPKGCARATAEPKAPHYVDFRHKQFLGYQFRVDSKQEALFDIK